MPSVVAALSKQQSITVWHQVGKDNLAGVKAAYQQQGQEVGSTLLNLLMIWKPPTVGPMWCYAEQVH